MRFLFALIALASFAIYSVLNKRTEPLHIHKSRLDDRIPFMPVFIVPYLLYLPYLFFITVYGIMVSPRFMEIAFSAVAVQAAAAAVYLLHQTHAPRPEVKGTDVFSRMTASLYQHDLPYCALPSLHVAYSVYCAYWSAHLFPAATPFFIAFSALIIVSTLFVKQHVLADLAGGMTVAALSLAVMGFIL